MEKKTLTEYIRFIDQLIADANFAPAGHHIHYLLNQFPKCAELYPRYGRVLTELNRFDEAILFYLRVTAVHPDDWIVFFTLAILYLNKNNPGIAARYVAYAACLEPERSEVKQLYRRLRAHLSDSVHDDIKKIELLRKAETYQDADEILEQITDAGINLLGCLLRPTDEGENHRKTHREILRRLPYCESSLHALARVYAKMDDLTRFQRYADRLLEIDPERSIHPDDDGSIRIESNPVHITYFDWTGFPNIRARSSWQDSQTRYLTVDEEKLAFCFELLPIPHDFFVPLSNAEIEPSRESEEFILKTDNLRPIATSAEDDLFFQEDYFQKQSAQLSESESLKNPERTKQPQDTAESNEKKLEDAFDYLERIVSEGVPQDENSFIEKALAKGLKEDSNHAESETSADLLNERGKPFSEADAGNPDPTATPVDANPEKPNDPEKTSELPTVENSEEMINERVRDAWTTFSKGLHDEAIEKYRDLVHDRVNSERIHADLTTLKILFPEIEALSELLSELAEKS